MDIKERVLGLVKNTDKGALGSAALSRVKLFCWETGLGSAINALPSVFGQQAVLYFPGRSRKFALPCCEVSGSLLLAVTADELKELNEQLLQNPGVEIWLKSGWYAGTARLLSDAEQAEVTAPVTDEAFFGEAGSAINKRRQTRYRLIEVTRSAPCTGNTGHGAKAWVWPVAALVLLVTRKKK